MNGQLFRQTVVSGLKHFFFFFILFTGNRFLFLTYYGNITEYRLSDLLAAVVMGWRFDVSAICYGFLPIALLWLVALGIPKRFTSVFFNLQQRFSKGYLYFLLFVFLTLLLIDFFYYQFFQSHINVLFFGIFNDDTRAVLQSVWTDYPIGYIVLIYIAVFVIFSFYLKKVGSASKSFSTNRITLSTLCFLLVFPLFFVGMRGSLGVFTLRREHTNVSSNTFVNSLCYNAVYALKFAYSELKANRIEPDELKELKKMGFTSEAEALQVYNNNVVDEVNTNFYTQTEHSEYLEQNPPNVVFVLMESMSNHYFELHSQELNLLGDLEAELPYLYYFKRGLSSFNGTIQSLENVLINTPKTIISQSAYFNTPFSSSVAKPFKNKGYETYFLTGSSISWRNIDNFIANQGYDHIEGGAHILQVYPEAEQFAWGVHDGYLFEYIEQKLKEQTDRPKFVFALTISNHTPYEVPESYHPYPVELNARLRSEVRVDEKMAKDNFLAHQYAASQLAKLIRRIRTSPLGKNTIIVATGDHNIRQVFEYSQENLFMKYSVPVLFYIPDSYRPDYFDATLFVSHKDIFPTIFNLSLSDQSYVYSGDNMFKKSKAYRFAVNNYDFIADSLGVLSLEGESWRYYRWIDREKRHLEPDMKTEKHAGFMLSKLKSFKTLQTLQIYKDIHHKKVGK